LNRFWSLEFMPFTLQSTAVGNIERTLQIHVEMYGKNDVSPSGLWQLISNETVSEAVFCQQGMSTCDALTIIDEEELDYAYYRVKLRVLNGGILPGNTEPFIGDVQLTFWRAHDGFSSLELSLKIVFMFISSITMVGFLYTLRDAALDTWSWEQRALALLLVGLLAFNPFFGLQYVVKGWFFHFLDALLYVLFLTDFLLFCLLAVDKIRLEEVRMEFSFTHLPKVVMVGIFAVLGTVLFAWVNIRDRLDPVIGRPDTVTAIEVLFYIEATLFVGILIWMGVLLVMAVPVAASKPYLLTRFLFVSIPTAFAVLSILVGIFSGTFGPVGSTSLSIIYFMTLYNVYVWVLTFGYWPVEQRFFSKNPSEGDRLTGFNDAPADL